tara:strand:+ start:44 stop:223 length:180 start_codon:yes stop_codon:yes gene_type:complete
MRINVNKTNSKVIDGRLFITGMKAHGLKGKLPEFIVPASTIEYPGMGKLYEYNGPYSRA